jgi:hypothetical protein
MVIQKWATEAPKKIMISEKKLKRNVQFGLKSGEKA